MSDSEINTLQKAAAADLKNPSKFAGSSDYESFGGGGRKSHSQGENNDFDMNKYLASLTAQRNATRGVAGLEKRLGTDQIGVAQDDIFKMIHRRYEAKKTTLNP